jgi:multidrug efflux pump subunit AcrA (membrane-fusion protein)
MRANLTTLQSGQRIARTDDSGQRYFVDDSQRQAETQKAQADLAENCK